MRQPSKMVARSTLNETTRQLNACERYIHLLANGEKPAAVESWQDGAGIATYELWGPLDASGGLIVSKWSHPHQSTSVGVMYYEDAVPQGYAPLECRLAYERLSIARNAYYHLP